MSNICVFCSANNGHEEQYAEVARDLGRRIGQEGHTLVYGGSNLGLMGVVARAAQEHGARIVGILPRFFEHLAQGEDELIIVESLYERKAVMERRADAFIALPGGLGTLDEIAGVISAKQLKVYEKPLVLINMNGFFTHLLMHIDRTIAEGFAKDHVRELYHVVTNPTAALEYIETYQPPVLPDKTGQRPPK